MVDLAGNRNNASSAVCSPLPLSPNHTYTREAILFKNHSMGSSAKDGLCIYVVVLAVVGRGWVEGGWGRGGGILLISSKVAHLQCIQCIFVHSRNLTIGVTVNRKILYFPSNNRGT